jgi:hypothetical protein
MIDRVAAWGADIQLLVSWMAGRLDADGSSQQFTSGSTTPMRARQQADQVSSTTLGLARLLS